ncbi:calponin [Neonectria punicea]|uniref:Calponin n=1 Tax=Neonectria punicea TaxID=979145 RepID=A0ABR1GJE7_9HYPO
MASVTSLDKDLRKMRLEKYTPAAANEARSWVEEILGTRLPSSDLLEGLKDGVALCKLVNLALPPPGVRFKQSAMPFVQMENISLFVRACHSPPLNLHQHDTFLTVDLYEQKDPAQVLQCLIAFSRAAHAANPQSFPTAIGGRSRSDALSPQGTGPATPSGSRTRGASVTSNSSSAYAAALPNRTGDSPSGRWSPTKSPTKSPQPNAGSPRAVTSWSKREHEGSTSPAWNIAQYGYLGGASQGNLGIAFGGRRQITTASPHVPNLAEKERRRKEQEAEEERLRREAEDEERRRVAEEEQARLEEERRWEAEAQQLREKERQQVEEEKRRWEEEERQWKLTEENRRKEEAEAEARLAEDRSRTRSKSDAKLRGQFLSQYRAEEATTQDGAADGYRSRVEELEKELELARQREAEYERDRQERQGRRVKARSRSRPRAPENKPKPRSRSRLASPPSRQDSWSRSDREVLSTKLPEQHDAEQQGDVILPPRSPRPLPEPILAQQVKTHHTGCRPLPQPNTAQPLKPQNTGGRPLPEPTVQQIKTHNTGGRPLPDPTAYVSKPAAPKPSLKPFAPKPVVASRTDRFLGSNPAPAPFAPQQTYSRELGATAERDAEDQRRAQSQAKTKAGGWASKSLLEREMEMERQRQKEWEDAQKETAAAVRDTDGVDGIGGGIGGRWDVGQWSGFTGGDSQNRGAQGIGAGRRQIAGPRPLPEPR